MKRLLGCFVAALFLVLAYPASALAAGPNPATVAGCYSLRLGPWQPLSASSEDAAFITPPAHIKLSASKDPAGWVKGSYILKPTRGSTSQHSGYFWRFTPDRALSLVFTTGFSGLTMALTPVGSNLEGTARSFWDYPRTIQTASVLAVREPCQER